MKRRLIAPLLLIALGLAALVPAERSLRQSRAASAGPAETTWVRYVMVGLGGFRGIISEVLWLRAAELQEQGRYFELIQLADWITALDPRAADAWVFNAWNLAYNVTAMLPDPAARLNWVNAGISLLADKAIPANPATPRLYRELAWLYQNKIGSDTDKASPLYRLALARAFDAHGKRLPDGPLAPLDAAAVAEVEARFGARDWRLAETHALYWAWRGLKYAPGGFERQALRRLIRQNAFNLVTAGRFAGDLEAGRFATAPDYTIVPGLVAFCEETVQEDPSEAQLFSMTLARLVQILAPAGREEEARRLYGRFVDLATNGDKPAPTFEQVLSGAFGQ